MSTNFGFHTTAEEAAAVLASEIKGKNVLITGVSPKSLGSEVARVIAKVGAGLVIIAGRSRAKLEQTEKDIKSETPSANIRILILDLDSLAAVRAAADEVLAYPEPLHVLFNNAGIMAIDYRKTVDGHEAQWGVNYLGHFLFTARIFPKLRESGNPRIVNVTSNGHALGSIRFDDIGFSDGEKYDRWEAYAQAKSANILFSRELARRGVLAFSPHPGGIMTGIASEAPKEDMMKFGIYNEKGEPINNEHHTWKTLGEGASTHIVAAFDPTIIPQNGSYLVDATVQDDQAAPHARDMEDAKKLWELSEQQVGEKFNV